MVIVSEAGAKHYRCRKGNIVEDRGYSKLGNLTESYLLAILDGLSRSEKPCQQDDMIAITNRMNEVIPLEFWRFFDYECVASEEGQVVQEVS